MTRTLDFSGGRPPYTLDGALVTGWALIAKAADLDPDYRAKTWRTVPDAIQRLRAHGHAIERNPA